MSRKTAERVFDSGKFPISESTSRQRHSHSVHTCLHFQNSGDFSLRHPNSTEFMYRIYRVGETPSWTIAPSLDELCARRWVLLSRHLRAVVPFVNITAPVTVRIILNSHSHWHLQKTLFLLSSRWIRFKIAPMGVETWRRMVVEKVVRGDYEKTGRKGTRS